MTRARTTAQAPLVDAIPDHERTAELQEFTRRNTGRRGTLEIDDAGLDAQAQVFDFPFLGVDWDRNDQLVEIMLGDAQPAGRRLTHSVGGVTSISVMRNHRGRDLGLRIAHGTGLTLFTFADA
jgi:hypothetical protein